MTDLRKILAIKPFVESLQIRVGYARFLRTAFWLRLLQISVMFNCRFKVKWRFVGIAINSPGMYSSPDESGKAKAMGSSGNTE